MRKLTPICVLALCLCAALLAGCGTVANSLTFGKGDLSATVTAVDGSSITVTVSSFGGMNTMPDGMGGEMGGQPDGMGGEMGTAPDGMGGEMGTMPDGMGGEMGGQPDGMGGNFDPSGNGGNGIALGSTCTAVLTLTDTSVLYKSENGTEKAAQLSDITVGSVLTVTFDEKGSIVKVVIGTADFTDINNQSDIPSLNPAGE